MPSSAPTPAAIHRLSMLARALRLPFLSVSVLPFLFGVLRSSRPDWGRSLLGLGAVAFTHLAANVGNDLADARSGADWQDLAYYGFFGGSKLIQEGRLSERFYARLAAGCAVAAIGCVLALVAWTGRLWFLPACIGIVALAAAYSFPPLRLAHRGLGEVVVFLLFGPACVVAGTAIQPVPAPLARPDVVAGGITFGLAAMAVLLANEVPDAADDRRVGKRTWVVRLGANRGWLLFVSADAAAVMAIIIAAAAASRGRTPAIAAILAPVALVPTALAALRLRRHPDNKPALVRASRFAALSHTILAAALLTDSVIAWMLPAS
jgi:1,4-dihydroxy-2-naphthoate octaprenyltransferase